jgi:putative ABC transport system permease protein
MTRTSRTRTVGLLLRHAASGAGASALVALLIATSVFAVALAPRALTRLGSAELKHALSTESPALLDLTGAGRIGRVEGIVDPNVESLLGATRDAIADLPKKLPRPLRDGAGEPLWVLRSNGNEADLGPLAQRKVIIKLAIDLDASEHVRYTSGSAPEGWAGDETEITGEPMPPIEIGMSAPTAELLEYEIGDVIAFTPADLVITGIYEPADPDDPYFVHVSDLLRATVDQAPGTPTTIRGSVYIAPESIVGLQNTMTAGQLAAWIPIDPAAYKYADAATLQIQARQLMSAQINLRDFGTLSFRTGLENAVQKVVARVTATSALLALSVSGLLGVLIAVFALGVQSVIARRRPALALAAARGAGTVQLRGAMVLEGLLLAGPGAVAGIVGAGLLIPETVGVEGWAIPGAVALAVPVLFAVLTSARGLREPRADLRVRTRSRVRWVIEVAVVALAALSLYLLTRRGLVESSEAVGIDPLLAATPLLLATAVCIGVLRLYPAPLLALQRRLRGRRTAAGLVGAARAVRDPALGFAAALALVVGISILVFSTVMATTIRAGLLQGARDDTGADIQVIARVLDDEVAGAVRAIDGVRAAAVLQIASSVELHDEAGATETFVLLTDTAALHAVRPDLPDLSTEVEGRVPVYASSDWASRIRGTQLTVGENGGEALLTGTVVPLALPGVSRHWILADDAFAARLGITITDSPRMIIRLDDGADSVQVAAEITEVVIAAQPEDLRGVVSVTDAVAELAKTRASPAVGSLDGVLLITAIVSLLLTMLSVVLASIAAATARNRLVGVLRILGMSPRQLNTIITWELAPVAVTAVVVGTLLGLVLPWIVTGALDLRPFVGGRDTPSPVVDLVWVAGAIAAFLLVVALSGLVAVLVGRRVAPAGTLKMGEG